MEITELLAHTTKHKASDLHLSSTHAPVLRINGDMLPLKMKPLAPDEVKAMIYSIMTEKQRADFERDYEIDFSIQFGETLRFRANAFNTINGPAISFRVIPLHVQTLEELHMPEILSRLASLNKGLILVTGPTGSGKSTTLAAMINHININQSRHIITIEDPVEFVHKSNKSLINQRELGSNTMSFSRALKSCLREDPDVILVGEMRDIETIQLALTAAETGHLVLASLHTNSAPKTVDRIVDAFPGADKPLIMSMLASSIEAVISQALIKRADDSGRVAALEIMIATPAIRNLVREGKIPQIYSMIQIGTKVGMRTMKDSVYALLEQGLITKEAAKSVLNVEGESEFFDEIDEDRDNKKSRASGQKSRTTPQVSKRFGGQTENPEGGF